MRIFTQEAEALLLRMPGQEFGALRRRLKSPFGGGGASRPNSRLARYRLHRYNPEEATQAPCQIPVPIETEVETEHTGDQGEVRDPYARPRPARIEHRQSACDTKRKED